MNKEILTYPVLQGHASILGVQIPVTEIDLKKAFRREALKWHPDREGGDGDKMRMVNKAYEVLSSIEAAAYGVYKLVEGEESVAVARLRNGRWLAELGLGLGPLQNGRDCPQCHHKGYTVFHDSRSRLCEECDGSGVAPEQVGCMACKGKGKLTTIDKRVIACGPCFGSGKVKHKTRRSQCSKCRGKGFYATKIGEPSFDECWQCNGTGELAIMNPVLPKGRLQNMKG